tara:strand:- start:170006 stop:171337 length:1332 start_codon:yes stop_codon:yes gene_type:complete
MLFIQILITSFAISASTLGLLDSGADPKQEILSKHLRLNKVEARGVRFKDDDKNGYIDDIEGWNFIEENGHAFDANNYGKFGDVFYKYYRIREKKALETWTPKEEAWYKEKREDEEFLEELKKFRSFIHGSHVAGIAMYRDHKRFGPLNFINVKYLGKAENGAAKEPEYKPLKKGSTAGRIRHLKKFITKYNTWQEGKLARAIDYVCKRAHVVNGSWGKSFKGSVKVVSQWYELEFESEPSKEISEELARLFLNNLIVRTQRIAKRYPHILFVFSAGNSKSDNDEFPHYPSDARGKNILAVGASNGGARTNSSNFGLKTVDLFAPGFLIASTTPENRVLKTTGTSQAAPRVSHAALVIRNINKSLLAPQIKRIIMETVDYNSEFISVSHGHLNLPRAIEAAKLSLKLSLPLAIKKAKKNVLPISFDKAFNSSKIEDDALPEPF